MRSRKQNKRLVLALQKLYKLCRFSSTQAGPIFYFLKHINETNFLRQPSNSPLPMNVYAAANLMSTECILRSYIVHCISISYLDMNIIYSRLVCISYEVYFIRIHGSSCSLFFFSRRKRSPAFANKIEEEEIFFKKNGIATKTAHNIVLQNNRCAQTNLAEWQILSMEQ